MLFAHDFTAEVMAEVVQILEEYASATRQPLRITSLPHCAIELMRSSGNIKYAFAASRDTADYIYNTADLQQLPGRKYQPKRNHLNRFNDFYDWTYEPLTTAHKDECLRLENDWQSHHHEDDTISAEQLAIVRAFDNFEALGLAGGAIRIGGRLAAFTYGSPVNDEVFDIHVEKADTSFEGIFPAINRCFAQTIPDRYRYINREEDMGLDGLRRSKLSYHPAALEDKFTALALTDEELSIRELWQQVFGDSREFIDKFLVDRKLYGVRTFVASEGSAVVSMVHTIPFTDVDGQRIAYIYGVATHPLHRNCGLATTLLHKALEDAAHGNDAAILIPSSEESARLYRTLGFADTELTVAFDTEFDFGSGSSIPDKVMILTFGENHKNTLSSAVLTLCSR